MQTRSLRWKLLAWHAAVMCIMAGVFGTLLYRSVRGAINSDIDAGLWAQADALANVIVPIDAAKFQVELTSDQVAFFRAEGAGAAHYAIWTGDGASVDESHPSLRIPPPTAEGGRDRESFREWSRRGPGGAWVLVGQDVARQREQLNRLSSVTVGAGAAALALLVGGGWFLTGRALEPISRISRATAAVSASNLSQRIDVSRMESELAGLAGSINDAFDRLQRAFEQQTQFTADASHELRTPLAVVLSHADFALKQPRSPDEYREALEAVHRAAVRMKGVVEGLLTLARADAGEIGLTRREFDLRDLVEETCRLLEPIAAEKSVTLNQRLCLAPITGDRDRLGEAVANIVSNAIRYNLPGGRVDVVLDASPAQVVLRVADTGRGIPEAEKSAIFARFYRSDQARSRSVDGSGLGLAITKWIVEAHLGSITCRDAAPRGTVFEVSLPRGGSR